VITRNFETSVTNSFFYKKGPLQKYCTGLFYIYGMKWFLREILTFSRSEMRIMLVLIGLIFMLIGIRYCQRRRVSIPEEVPPELMREARDFIADLTRKEDNTIKSKKRAMGVNAGEGKRSLELFPFDPNRVTRTELKAMGLSSQVAANLLKYREAGGYFREADDMKKIYGLESSVYEDLMPYILIPKRKQLKNQEKTIQMKDPAEEIIIDLNHAGTDSLEMLFGIGDILSERIVRYRELLGGFYSVQQLREVYGIPDSVVQINADRIVVDSTAIRKISLAKAEFKEFLRHPYIEMHQVKHIMKLRNFHEGNPGINDLIQSRILDDSILTRVLPYLTE